MSAKLAPPVLSKWTVQQEDSAISWSTWKMFFIPVHGSFTSWSGVVDIDLQDLPKSSVEIQIELASVDTGYGLMAGFGLREWHIRHAHYLEVTAYPTAHFRSDQVRLTDGVLEIDGMLDLHGVKRAVTLTGRVEVDEDNRRVFQASTVIDRYDYGVTMGKLFEGFGMMVGNLITLDIRVALAQA
jgi:polyisoprenoid-binding protein YceI